VSLASILESLLGQLIALAAFFIFPTIQYIMLKIISRKEGTPELWYLPSYGFRLVIRNKPMRKILKGIRYSIRVLESVPSPDGCVTKTTRSALSYEGEKLLLFPDADLILMSFQLQSDHEETRFIYTDAFGEQKKNINIAEFKLIRCDYLATIHNYFNFHIQIGKRIIINKRGQSHFK
jgi:hypothetical protein